jgi:hypothetical protein
MDRKPISKRLRFEVFKRDSFTCQYCSAKPPRVPLEVDHIIPVSKSGDNTISNLITACFDCNRGKSNIELHDVPLALIDTIERKRIAQSQYLEFKKIINEEKKILAEEILEIEKIYSTNFDGYEFSDKFSSNVGMFIKELGFSEVEDAMEKACIKVYHHEQKVLKYFCAICWHRIKGTEPTYP